MCHSCRAQSPSWSGWAAPAGDAAGAGDPYGLLGVWESEPARRGHGQRLDGAGLAASVATIAGLMPDRDLCPRLVLEQGMHGGLVGLDGDHQLPAGRGHGVGVAHLGVQRVRDDDRAGQ